MSPSPINPTMITFYGQTASGITSALIPMNSDILYQGVSTISIPRGTELKIWAVRVSGSQIIVAINYSKTISGAFISSIVRDVFAFNPANQSPTYLEKNKPLVIEGDAGGETIYLTYTQTSAVPASYVEFDAELVDLSI